MKIEKIVVGSYQTNCYLLIEDNQMLIIDPGSNFRKISEKIDEYPNAEVKAILLTHGHFDHIGAVDKLYEKYHCTIYANSDDEKILRNENLNYHQAIVNSPICWLDGNKLNIDKFNVEVIYSPGHTEGSVMYIIDGCLFSGDTLFKQSVGRTDLYSGNRSKLLNSLQVVYTLNPNMTVYPGHEQDSTIGFELKNNPYL